jgi:hypothetical protein
MQHRRLDLVKPCSTMKWRIEPIAALRAQRARVSSVIRSTALPVRLF